MSADTLAASPTSDRLADAVAAFRRDGVVVIEDVVDPALLARCRDEIERDYSAEQLAGKGSFGLDTDPRRFSVALVADGALAERDVLVNPLLLDFARALIGDDPVMDSFGLLMSLPGAPDQRTHFDAMLFPETPLDRVLPPTTIAISMPLVVMDETSGSTAFWRGSHRGGAASGDPDFAPRVAVGSVLLWDYRIVHRGLANRGDRPRPVLFSALCREWWHESKYADTKGYDKLAVARRAWAGFDRPERRVLRRATVRG